jgi:hypothetical protein
MSLTRQKMPWSLGSTTLNLSTYIYWRTRQRQRNGVWLFPRSLFAGLADCCRYHKWGKGTEDEEKGEYRWELMNLLKMLNRKCSWDELEPESPLPLENKLVLRCDSSPSSPLWPQPLFGFSCPLHTSEFLGHLMPRPDCLSAHTLFLCLWDC